MTGGQGTTISNFRCGLRSSPSESFTSITLPFVTASIPEIVGTIAGVACSASALHVGCRSAQQKTTDSFTAAIQAVTHA